MAKKVLLDAFVSIGGNDLSAYCFKVEVPVQAEAKEVTTFGSGGWKEHLGGLKEAALNVGFRNDLAAAAVDSILWPLLGTVVAFEVRAAQAAVGVSNPKYTGNVLITEHKPIIGSVGDVNEFDASYPTSGVVVRATA